MARHQTLQALIEWGHALLSEREQAVFAQLAVFAGGWSLDAAEAVVGDGSWVMGHGGNEESISSPGTQDLSPNTLDVLARLVEKSLVVADVGARGGARYRLLETLRQYAWERLAERGAEPVRDRHAHYFLELAGQIEPKLEGDDLAGGLDALEQEYDNLRAALHWLRERGDIADGLRLATSLRLFWHLRGHLAEGREWLDAFLALDPGVPAELRARALDASGFLARFQGHYAVAEPLIRESLALRRQLGDRQAVADALNNLGSILLAQGEYQQASALYDEGLATYRVAGHRQGTADSRSHLGLIAFHERDLPAAREAHAESLAIRRDLADQWGIAESLDGFAMLAAAEHESSRALRLAGAAAALCGAAGLIVAPVRRAQVDAALEPVRWADGAAATVAWEAGWAMPLGEAISSALAGEAPTPAVEAERVTAAVGADAALTAGPGGAGAHLAGAAVPRLTRRETEVAVCLARALSNREIADALCISERTVERHVENILAKLDLHSRTQVAVWVAGHGADAGRHSPMSS